MKELDRTTLQRAIKGDKKAFKMLYELYAPFSWRVLFRMTGGDRVMTEELVQETFVHVHRSLKDFKSNSAVSTWIYRIAFNAGMNIMQRIRKFPTDSYEDNFASTEKTDKYEAKELVSKILDKLTAQERFLLTAREVDGMSYEELASVMNTSETAARTRLHRIKEFIRNSFVPDMESEANDVF